MAYGYRPLIVAGALRFSVMADWLCVISVDLLLLDLLWIILEMVRAKTQTEIADEQAGFQQERGTRDQITNQRILMHEVHEHQQPLYMCFVDFKPSVMWQ